MRPDPTPKSPAEAANFEVVEAYFRHLRRMYPETWQAMSEKYLMPMASDPACIGNARAAQAFRNEKTGNPGNAFDALLVGFAYCTEAGRACQAGRDADAWPLLLIAERCNGIVEGLLQAESGRPLGDSRSNAELEDRIAAMRQMRESGMTYKAIAEAQSPPIKRQTVEKLIGKRSR